MPNLTCPECGGPLDLVTRGTVATLHYSFTYDHGVLPAPRLVERTADFVACSRCEYAATVAGVHRAAAALEATR
jgi:hypothetical protein